MAKPQKNNEAYEEGNQSLKVTSQTHLATQESQRAIAEVQGAIIIARRNPRDQQDAIRRIKLACQRQGLAEAANYSYPRGNTTVTSHSIRLAEAVALEWQNVQYGVRELEQRNGESVAQAYAWDMENNVRVEKIFTVPHIRYSKAQGNTLLTDPRDIYEMVANNGARRLRSCITQIIPGDIWDLAVAECDITLKSTAKTDKESIKVMIEKFVKLGVSQKQIEKYIKHDIEDISSANVVALRKIFNSLSEGMSKVVDWFEVGTASTESVTPKEAVTASDIKPKSVNLRQDIERMVDEVVKKDNPDIDLIDLVQERRERILIIAKVNILEEVPESKLQAVHDSVSKWYTEVINA